VRRLEKIKNKFANTDENNKVIFYNATGAFFVRGGALIVSLLTMPAYINYFGNQQVLGLWFTALSVLSWILTFDLGIGNGLRNHLVYTLIHKDHLGAKKYISSAYVIIGIIVFIAILLSTLLFKFINWNLIFNISNDIVSIETLNVTVGIIFSGIMLQFLLKLITSILYAMQKSAITNFLSLISSITILLYVSFTEPTNITSNLISLAIIHVMAINIPLLIATIIIFSNNLKGLGPNINYFERSYAGDVIKLGGLFFWVQIMYMIITVTNELLISWLAEPKMVVEYQIYNKLFTLVGTIFTLALTPIWSAVTKALSEGKYNWINNLYKRLKLLALLAVICEFIMIPFLQIGINVWLGENAIKVNYFHAFIFAISGSLFIWNGVVSSIANGFGELKTQSIYFTIGAIIKVPIAWILVELLNSWIGVIIANIIAMSLYCIVQPNWLRKFLKKKELGVDSNV
jgi:O-antigen/teichoic acid export membrane protein